MQQKTLWSEDECTRGLPGHETLEMAWQRLFGEPYDQGKATDFYDHGETTERRFGRISVYHIFGAWYTITEDSDPDDGD